MRTSQHAMKRIKQRGLNLQVLRIIEETVLSKYRNQSQQIFFKRKDASVISSEIRRLADKVEKSAGTTMVLDPSGLILVTVHRKSR